jgi:antitoxin component YwqK of YwqJK toxin-antitoxin module
MDLKRVETRYAYGEGFPRTICHTGPDRKGRTKLQGEYIEFYNEPGEKIKKKGSYKDGRIDGLLLEYYQDGKLSCKSLWKEGQMIYLVEYDQQGRIIKNYGESPNE